MDDEPDPESARSGDGALGTPVVRVCVQTLDDPGRALATIRTSVYFCCRICTVWFVLQTVRHAGRW